MLNREQCRNIGLQWKHYDFATNTDAATVAQDEHVPALLDTVQEMRGLLAEAEPHIYLPTLKARIKEALK